MKEVRVLAPAKWVRLPVLEVHYGFTKNAVEKYKARGIWTYGQHYKKDPTNRYVYSTEAINTWLEQSH